MLQIFRQLVVLLGSDSNVVHTYAAVAVERLLAQRVSSNVSSNPFWSKVSVQFWLTKVRLTWQIGMQEDGKQRFQVQDLAPVLDPLLQALFSAFLKPDSAENEYVMRCIMRVIDFVGPEVSSMITMRSAG